MSPVSNTSDMFYFRQEMAVHELRALDSARVVRQIYPRILRRKRTVEHGGVVSMCVAVLEETRQSLIQTHPTNFRDMSSQCSPVRQWEAQL